jgi:hypothetical protein
MIDKNVRDAAPECVLKTHIKKPRRGVAGLKFSNGGIREEGFNALAV